MIPMVTSSWDHWMLHPRGLVPILLDLWCQFRGDWSQRMAGLTSESDSHIFAGKEIQPHLSFQSHYGYGSRLSESASACGTIQVRQDSECSRGAFPLFIEFVCLSLTFRFQSRANLSNLKEGDQLQMWEFLETSSISSELLYSVRIIFKVLSHL